MSVGGILNIILDPIFIFTLGMEIRGAAIATILGNGAGMLVSLYYYLSGKTLLRPSFTYVRPTSEILREIFWVGVPATLETLLTSAAYIVNNNLAVQYGELTVAAIFGQLHLSGFCRRDAAHHGIQLRRQKLPPYAGHP